MAIDPRKLRFAFQQALLGDRNQQEPIDGAVDPRQIGDEIDLVHQVVGVEARVLGAIDQETEHRFQVERVPGPGRDEHRVLVLAGAIARRVTDRAVVAHALEADRLLDETDRQFLALLPREAERGEAIRSGNLLRKHPRQHIEDPVRNAGVAFAADGAVLEAHLRIARDPFRLRLLRERTCTSRTSAPRGDQDARTATTRHQLAFCHCHVPSDAATRVTMTLTE